MNISEMSQPYIEKIFATVVKEYMQQFSMAKENLHAMSHVDLTRHFEDHCFRIYIAMQGRFEENYERSEEALPASLKEWIKFYVRKIPWGWLQRHIAIRNASLVTHHNTTYHMCPHLNIDRKFPHFAFMNFGSPFEKLSADAERAANEIIQTALKEMDGTNHIRGFLSSELTSAIMRYKKAMGI